MNGFSSSGPTTWISLFPPAGTLRTNSSNSSGVRVLLSPLPRPPSPRGLSGLSDHNRPRSLRRTSLELVNNSNPLNVQAKVRPPLQRAESVRRGASSSGGASRARMTRNRRQERKTSRHGSRSPGRFACLPRSTVVSVPDCLSVRGFRSISSYPSNSDSSLHRFRRERSSPGVAP